MGDSRGGEPLEYLLVSLASLKEYDLLYNEVIAKLAEFKCTRSSHLEDYARSSVLKWENHGHSKTYVFIVADGDDIAVPAFFAIGMNVLDLSQAKGAGRKKLMGSISQEQTGAFCITELARSDDFSSSQLPGNTILDEAKNVVRSARSYVGGRFLVVDSRREVFEKLYSKYGFREIGLAARPKGMEEADFVTSCCVIKDW